MKTVKEFCECNVNDFYKNRSRKIQEICEACEAYLTDKGRETENDVITTSTIIPSKKGLYSIRLRFADDVSEYLPSNDDLIADALRAKIESHSNVALTEHGWLMDVAIVCGHVEVEFGFRN